MGTLPRDCEQTQRISNTTCARTHEFMPSSFLSFACTRHLHTSLKTTFSPPSSKDYLHPRYLGSWHPNLIWRNDQSGLLALGSLHAILIQSTGFICTHPSPFHLFVIFLKQTTRQILAVVALPSEFASKSLSFLPDLLIVSCFPHIWRSEKHHIREFFRQSLSL